MACGSLALYMTGFRHLMYVIVVDVKTATYDLLLDLISKLDILFGKNANVCFVYE